MIKAIIDLGTNTFNLLIADVKENHFELIHSEEEGVAIGMGGINTKRITPESMQRGVEAIAHFLAVCKTHQVETIAAFGTSALRDAENTADFLAQLYGTFQLKVEVISGQKEAELIYLGVRQLYAFDEKAVIVDIGGGSTEIIFANKSGVSSMASLNVGVSRIYQKFKLSDPLSQADIVAIRSFLEEQSQGYFDYKEEATLIGSSGSFETFWEMSHLQDFSKEQRLSEIRKADFETILNQTIHSTLQERNENPFILPIRRIMAPITAVKIHWIMEKLKTQKILISPFSLKEGALFSKDVKS